MAAGTKHPRSSEDDETAQPPPPPPVSPVVAMFQTFRNELDEHHDRRERIIKASRDITALSKKMIFSLQRVRNLSSPLPPNLAKELASQHAKTSACFAAVAPDLQGINAWRYQAQISPGIQEYVEAVSFRHYLETQRLVGSEEVQKVIPGGMITLTEEDYLLGLFDFVGEVMRFAITGVAVNGAVPRGNNTTDGDGEGGEAGGRDILTDLRSLRAGLEGLDGVGRRVERKGEVMRACVEKVEGAAYGVVVRGRERPKGWVMDTDGGGERRGGGGVLIEGYMHA